MPVQTPPVIDDEILSWWCQSVGRLNKVLTKLMSLELKTSGVLLIVYDLTLTWLLTEVSGKTSINYSKCWSRRSLACFFEALGILIPPSPSGSSQELFSPVDNWVPFQKGLSVTAILIGHLRNNLKCTCKVWNDCSNVRHQAMQLKGLKYRLLVYLPCLPDYSVYHLWLFFLYLVNSWPILLYREAREINKRSANSPLYIPQNELLK